MSQISEIVQVKHSENFKCDVMPLVGNSPPDFMRQIALCICVH